MIQKLNYPQFWLFVLAWFLADILTPVIIWLAHTIGAVDKPHSYKSHKAATPFLGGLAIYIAFAITIFTILRFEKFSLYKNIFAIIFGGFFLAILGIVDDFKSVPAVIKLIIIVGVTFILAHFGIVISLFNNYYLDIALTVLWLAGVTSAMNSLDNMDGVATGITAIASFFTFYLAWYSIPPQKALSYVAITLFGASLGLLRYNFKPARIFLGNNGAMLLGFLLASMTVLAGWSKKDPIKAVVIPCAILAVPLYDITLSTILRYKNKVVKSFVEAIVYCGKDHISHRLVALGFSQTQATLILYLFGTISGTIAILIEKEDFPMHIYLPITVLSLAVLGVFGFVLNKARVYEKDKT